MKKRENSNFDYNKATNFVNMKTEYGKDMGFLNNLCN